MIAITINKIVVVTCFTNMLLNPQPAHDVKDPYEDALHLISTCSYAAQVWSPLGLPAPTSLTTLHQQSPILGLNHYKKYVNL
jgi:hypothetical protein